MGLENNLGSHDLLGVPIDHRRFQLMMGLGSSFGKYFF
jgi:hypothetical protein